MFTPNFGGRWTHFDEQIFQRGWFNHQLEKNGSLEIWVTLLKMRVLGFPLVVSHLGYNWEVHLSTFQYIWDLLKSPNLPLRQELHEISNCNAVISRLYHGDILRPVSCFFPFWVGDIRSDWKWCFAHRNICIYIYIWFICCLFATSFKTKACYIPRKFTITVFIFQIVYVAWVAWELCDGKVRTYLGCNVCFNEFVVWVLSPYFRY